MSFSEALNLPLSFGDMYYESEVWPERKKEIQAENQTQDALFKHLANLQTLLANRR
jgi:hypothetical protein